MASNDMIHEFAPAKWYRLNDTPAAKIAIQNQGADNIRVYATETLEPPTSVSVGYKFDPGEGGFIILADAFLSQTDPQYLWVMAGATRGRVYANYA